MGLKYFSAGFVACLLLLTGCASFAYKNYGMEGVNFSEGSLLGPKPEQDLPFSHCEPTAAKPHPCTVMFSDEFSAFKLDYLDTKEKLKACEAQRQIKE